MARRTIVLPDAIEESVRRVAREGESFSAAVSRLLDAGIRALGAKKAPDWIGAGKGPGDLGINAERYLRRLARGAGRR